MKRQAPSQTLESDRDTLTYVVAAFLFCAQLLSEAENSRINVTILFSGTLFLLVIQMLGHFKKLVELERRAESDRDHVDTILFRGQQYNTLEDEDAERGLLIHVTGKMHKLIMGLSLVLCAGGIVYAFATQPGSVWKLSTSLHLLALMAWSQAYLPRHNVAAITLGFLAVASTWKPEMSWWQSVQTLGFIPLLASIMALRVFQNGIMSGEKSSLLTVARIRQISIRSLKMGMVCICIANALGWMTSKSEQETFLNSLSKAVNKINYKAGEIAMKFAQEKLAMDLSRVSLSSQSGAAGGTSSAKGAAASGGTGHSAGETAAGAASTGDAGTQVGEAKNETAANSISSADPSPDLGPATSQTGSSIGSQKELIKELTSNLSDEQIKELRESAEWQEARAKGMAPSEADQAAAARLLQQLSANANSVGQGSSSSSQAGGSSASGSGSTGVGKSGANGHPQISPELAQSLLKGMTGAKGHRDSGDGLSESTSAGGGTAGSSSGAPTGNSAVGLSKSGNSTENSAENSTGARSGSAGLSEAESIQEGTRDAHAASSTPKEKSSEHAVGKNLAKPELEKPREVQPLVDPKTIERWTPWLRLLIVIGIMALVVLLIEPLFRKKKNEEDILDQDLPPNLAKEVLRGLSTLQRTNLSVEDEIRIRYLTFLNIMQILRNPRPEYLPTWEFYAEVRNRHEQIDQSARVMTDVFSRFTYGKEIPNTEGLNSYRTAFMEIEKRTIALVRAYQKSA